MNNHLFLIGINKYKHHTNLESCVKDCNDFKDILIEKFDFELSNVYELYDEEDLERYFKQLNKNENEEC